MAISTWWAENPEQRYWMEITDRQDLGRDLRAPKTGQSGRAVFHYELVRHTRPGDLVFHWHKVLAGEPAIVGWSEVVGPLREGDIAWVPQTERTMKGHERPLPGWQMPLGSLHLLDNPITRNDLLGLRNEILGLANELNQKIPGFAYYPFNKYGDSLRAYQGYLVKFPAELIPIVEQVGSLEIDTPTGAGTPRLPEIDAPAQRGSGAGFLRDVKLRLALEQHAVELAIEYYQTRGATDIEILGKPYDLRIQIHGTEYHVEVKGSSQFVDKVFLTRNEVSHARDTEHVDLVVVDNIRYEAIDGAYRTSGGRFRIWESWDPAEDSLTPITYSHTLAAPTAHRPLEQWSPLAQPEMQRNGTALTDATNYRM